MELLWFSWSSGGRVQYLVNNNQSSVQTLRTPDYVCSLDGKSEFNMLRDTWEYSLDWRDTKLRDREKYVMAQIMEHVAVWEANNEQPHIIVGVQLGNEARGHGGNNATSAEIIEYYHAIGDAIEKSKHVVWTRLNCVSYETSGRISANETKRNNGGTNIDFIGIDIYGTSASSIKGNMNGQLGSNGRNYRMIMEIDAKDSNSPIYQMAALAGDKAFDYYNMCVVDGNALYTNNGTTLVERNHITEVRQRNKILNLANQDVALKSHGSSLYVYNYAGNSIETEKGIEGIFFKPATARSQAIAIRRSPSEIILLVTGNGAFAYPESLGVVSASKGYFNENNEWVDEEPVSFTATSLTMPATSAVRLVIPVTDEEVVGIIKNPSFEGDSYQNTANYVVPKEWMLNATLIGADVQLKSGDANDGEFRYYIWTETGGQLDLSQDIVLPAGEYVLKTALKSNASNTIFLYADVAGSVTQVSAEGSSWNSWITIPVPFTVMDDDTTVRIGVKASNAIMVDNFRLLKKNNVNSVCNTLTSKEINVIGKKGGIWVNCKDEYEKEKTVIVYSVLGQIVDSVKIVNERFIPLQTGIYIVNNQKVIVQ